MVELTIGAVLTALAVAYVLAPLYRGPAACLHCGARPSVTAVFCSECGARLGSDGGAD